MKACFRTWKDWKFPIRCIVTLIYPVVYATAINFFPLVSGDLVYHNLTDLIWYIVECLGYSVIKTNLWTVAPNLVGAVVLLCVAKSSD